MNKKKIAHDNKTFPDYIDDNGKVIFKNNKEWNKDPLEKPVDIKKKNIKLYLNYIIPKNFKKWKRQMSWDELKNFAPQIIASNISDGNNFINLIENLLQNLEVNINEYKINLDRFNALYKEEKKVKLKKTRLVLENIVPKQIRQSAVFKTKIKSLIYHFNNIKLGYFAFALYDNYVKITKYLQSYSDIIEEENSDEYILLSDNTTKFYISVCKDGLLVEFDYNYYQETNELKPKCNFIDQQKNIVDINKILDKISHVLQIKVYKVLLEDYTQASFQIKFHNINKSIWAYLVMNNKIFSKYITIPELRLSKLNNRFFFKLANFQTKVNTCKSYLELKNKKLNFGDITANYFNINKDIIEIFVSRSLGKESIKLFQKQLLSLIEYHYEPNIKKIIKIYKNYSVTLDIIKFKSTKKKSLKNNYPGYFNIGYSTNCGPKKQPVILNEKQVKQMLKKKINPNLILKAPASPKDIKLVESGKYPEIKNYTNSQGYKSLYFICNKRNIHGYVPSDKGNKFPRLNIDNCPCCKTKKKKIKEKSETSSYTKGNALCKGICALPPLLKNIFLMLDPTKEYHRQSATPNILKLLNAIFNKKFTKKNISEYKFLGISKQENWDIFDIKKCINDRTYIDVSRCIRILEELYQCKLFIFQRKQPVSRNIIQAREIPTLLVPNHNYYTNYYSWNESDKPTIIFFAHFGTTAHLVTDIHYELLTQTDWEHKIHKNIFNSNDIIIQSLYKFQNMINESYCLNKEIFPITKIKLNASEQIIDYYGKCRGIIVNKIPLLFDPIPPMNIAYKNLCDIEYVQEVKIIKKCKLLDITILKKYKNYIKGRYKGLNVIIPIKTEKKCTFNENRKNAKYVIALIFYLFSKFTRGDKSIDISKFFARHVKISKNIKYEFRDIIFDKDCQEVEVANSTIKKHLQFVLMHKLANDEEMLRQYYKNKIIPDFFNEIRDFTSYSNQIILYKDTLKKDIGSNFLIRFKDEQLDTMIPYFSENNNKLWIYQNCQNEKIRELIEETWDTDHYNNIDIIKNSKNKFLAKLEI